MIGFPIKCEDKSCLRTFLNRFLWINIFHTSINYALSPDFIPTSPTKLYHYTDGREMPFFQAIPATNFNYSVVWIFTIFDFSLTKMKLILIKRGTAPETSIFSLKFLKRLHSHSALQTLGQPKRSLIRVFLKFDTLRVALLNVNAVYFLTKIVRNKHPSGFNFLQGYHKILW